MGEKLSDHGRTSKGAHHPKIVIANFDKTEEIQFQNTGWLSSFGRQDLFGPQKRPVCKRPTRVFWGLGVHIYQVSRPSSYQFFWLDFQKWKWKLKSRTSLKTLIGGFQVIVSIDFRVSCYCSLVNIDLLEWSHGMCKNFAFKKCKAKCKWHNLIFI